jgi:uncharacterized membrane protein
MKNKAQIWEELGPWIIGAVFLAIALAFVYLLSTGRLAAALEALKNLVGSR